MISDAPITVVGLYRVDWQDIGMREVRTIVAGAALGLVATWLLNATLFRSERLELRLLAAAWGAIVLGLGGTRVFVRTLDEKIRRERSANPHTT